jgi:hypothetical protein
MDTLFGHLALSFSSHPENLATEGLHYILSRSAEARRLFLQFLGQAGVSFGNDLVFTTQAADATGAIPDLVGKDEQGTEVAIIEAKFWAGLTERQPVAYLKRLPPSSGLLAFVAPARRFESLWPELLTRCQNAWKGEVEVQDGQGADWRVARITGGRRLALTSWRAMLGKLRDGLQEAEETDRAADVLQLQGLADRMDAEAFLPLTSEELTSNLGTRIVQFCDLVDSAVERLVNDKLADTTRLRMGGSHGAYSRFLRLHKTNCSLDFDPANWSRHGRLIWLTALGGDWKSKSVSPDVKEALHPLAHETPPRLLITQSGVQVPIDLPTQVERDAVLEAMLTQIRRVAELLKSVPPAAPSSRPPDA